MTKRTSVRIPCTPAERRLLLDILYWDQSIPRMTHHDPARRRRMALDMNALVDRIKMTAPTAKFFTATVDLRNCLLKVLSDAKGVVNVAYADSTVLLKAKHADAVREYHARLLRDTLFNTPRDAARRTKTPAKAARPTRANARFDILTAQVSEAREAARWLRRAMRMAPLTASDAQERQELIENALLIMAKWDNSTTASKGRQ